MFFLMRRLRKLKLISVAEDDTNWLGLTTYIADVKKGDVEYLQRRIHDLEEKINLLAARSGKEFRTVYNQPKFTLVEKKEEQ